MGNILLPNGEKAFPDAWDKFRKHMLASAASFMNKWCKDSSNTFEEISRINELRKICGVEDKGRTTEIKFRRYDKL